MSREGYYDGALWATDCMDAAITLEDPRGSVADVASEKTLGDYIALCRSIDGDLLRISTAANRQRLFRRNVPMITGVDSDKGPSSAVFHVRIEPD